MRPTDKMMRGKMIFELGCIEQKSRGSHHPHPPKKPSGRQNVGGTDI